MIMGSPIKPAMTPDGPRARSTRGIQIEAGLTIRDEDACVCGHWTSAHRNGGKSTCEGFRCGCYTFRKVENPDNSTRGPRCQVCDKPVTSRRVTPLTVSAYEVEWWHAGNLTATCKTTGSMAEDSGFKPSVTDDEDAWDQDSDMQFRGPKEWLGQQKAPDSKPRPMTWEEELEHNRIERSKPTRAPFEIGEDHV